MKNNKIRLLLFVTVLVMTILPLSATFYFLDNILQTSLNLGFNPQVVRVLGLASQNLKRLKVKDPENESKYRDDFEQVENLKVVYSKPQLLKNKILTSLKIYFGIGLLIAVLISVAIATMLSRKIARSYTLTLNELVKQKEKVRYLEEISAWQDLARMLAHEIKNPLTPIEILITSLSRSYLKKSKIDFEEQLAQTEVMISEELTHLKNLVNRFSEFSKIPKVQLRDEVLMEIIQQSIRVINESHTEAEVKFTGSEELGQVVIKLDATLFRQVFTNIVRNGIEANPGKKLYFKVSLSKRDEVFRITISNNGVPVSKELEQKIFEPYVSSKIGKDNMGLGLAIVKKIIIEHGGEITYAEENGWPTFIISLKGFN